MLDQVHAAIRWAAIVTVVGGVCFHCCSTWAADGKQIIVVCPQQCPQVCPLCPQPQPQPKPANKPQTKSKPKPKNEKKQLLIDAHNRIRKSHGKNSLKRNPHLMKTAQEWANHMAKTGVMSHQELSSDEFNGMGENCAIGASVTEVMNAWMKSPGHKGNILDTFTHIGVGVAVGEKRQTFWCVDFGRLE